MHTYPQYSHDAAHGSVFSSGFMATTYALFGGGLMLSTLVALLLVVTNLGLIFSYVPFVGMFVVLAQLGLVFGLSFFIDRMPAALAGAMFFLYSILMGVTMSYVFYVYSLPSIISTFGIATLLFGSMAVYGYTTGQDLTKFGSIAIMGLIGIILASIANLVISYFFPALGNIIYWVQTYAGVAVFLTLAAWDAQRIKTMGVVLAQADNSTIFRYSVIAALNLYLDFVNLFFYLLRIFGGKKD